MFRRKKSAKQTPLDLFREKLATRIGETEDPKDLKELAEAVTLMEKLDELGSKHRISPDTLAIIGGNLVGILLILQYERCHVVASKAIGFVMRGRV